MRCVMGSVPGAVQGASRPESRTTMAKQQQVSSVTNISDWAVQMPSGNVPSIPQPGNRIEQPCRSTSRHPHHGPSITNKYCVHVEEEPSPLCSDLAGRLDCSKGAEFRHMGWGFGGLRLREERLTWQM